MKVHSGWSVISVAAALTTLLFATPIITAEEADAEQDEVVKQLDLEGTNIDGSGLKHLRKLKNLRELHHGNLIFRAGCCRTPTAWWLPTVKRRRAGRGNPKPLPRR